MNSIVALIGPYCVQLHEYSGGLRYAVTELNGDVVALWPTLVEAVCHAGKLLSETKIGV